MPFVPFMPAFVKTDQLVQTMKRGDKMSPKLIFPRDGGMEGQKESEVKKCTQQ